MADYGVTPTGFRRKRLADIRPEIIAALRNNLQTAGLSGDIETRPDSVMGLLIDTFAEREAALWELAEGVYAAMYPSTASGSVLDNAVSFTGVIREGATRSRGYVLLVGEGGTTVPAGSQIRSVATQEVWEIESESRITRSNTAAATLVVLYAGAGAYTVYIDGTAYTYTASSGQSAAQIAAGIAAGLTDTQVSAVAEGERVNLEAGAGSGFPLGFSNNLGLTYLGSPAVARTLLPSTLGADAGTLTQILTDIEGWTSVTNAQPASAGVIAESDSSLRNRYALGMYRLGGATLRAIAARVRAEAPGVTNVVAFENTGDYADSIGRPPHSVHVIAEGGLDLEIARAIYDSKAAGIDTFGAFAVGVENDQGLQTIIRFDRPVPVYVWIRAQIQTLSPDEQSFPDAGLAQIGDALAARGDELGIGDDVVWQSFFRAVYSVSGVAYAQLLFATSSDPAANPPTSAYSAANVTILPQQRAMFDPARIEVTSGP